MYSSINTLFGLSEVITVCHSTSLLPCCHLLSIYQMVINRHGAIAMTGRVHCGRQVAFFHFCKMLSRSVLDFENLFFVS